MTLETILPTWQRLSTKIVSVLLGFLFLALMSIGVTLFLSWQLEGSSAAINEAGSLRMHSYRLTMLLSRWANEPEQELTRQAARQELATMAATFSLLQRGDPQRPLFLPPTAGIHDEFTDVLRQWQQKLKPLASAILAEDHLAAADQLAAIPPSGREFRGGCQRLGADDREG